MGLLGKFIQRFLGLFILDAAAITALFMLIVERVIPASRWIPETRKNQLQK
jgi:hypothetical protein